MTIKYPLNNNKVVAIALVYHKCYLFLLLQTNSPHTLDFLQGMQSVKQCNLLVSASPDAIRTRMP